MACQPAFESLNSRLRGIMFRITILLWFKGEYFHECIWALLS